eukprot:Phypoly_transcript_08226.p1 GENE.Phypoly_transcript_08226~~Phypoly_transcript_08226.p1  ORF type:complete len:250 (+),score=36.60 Phypoly_transcript_08226:634-1383(+)
MSGIWEWNKNERALSFPITLYVTGTTRQTISTTVEEMDEGRSFDFGDQFIDVVGFNGTNCPMTSSPTTIYEDSVAYGWDASYSFGHSFIDQADRSSPYEGTAAIHAGLFQFGGLLFTRNGGFNPQYFSQLTFAAKASFPAQIKIYTNSNSNPHSSTSLFATRRVGTQWATYNVSVATLTTRDIEFGLAFLNMEGRMVQLWLDSVRWMLAENSPLDLIPPIAEILPFLETQTGNSTNETGIVSHSSKSEI